MSRKKTSMYFTHETTNFPIGSETTRKLLVWKFLRIRRIFREQKPSFKFSIEFMHIQFRYSICLQQFYVGSSRYDEVVEIFCMYFAQFICIPIYYTIATIFYI